MRTSSFHRPSPEAVWLKAVWLAAALAIPTGAEAQQIVVADVTYEHSATTTFDSHYRVDPAAVTPADLTSPVDYASGDAVVRLEVFTKPSDAGTRFQICFEASPTYACTDQAPAYTTTGVYTWTTPFSRFYQGDMVDWSLGLGRIAMILKDTMNNKPSPENVGAEESARYMPTSIRVTVTLVPPGATYEPPPDTVDSGVTADAGSGPDAGSLDAGARDAGARDAGSGLDAGASAPTSAGCAASPGAPSAVVAMAFGIALLAVNHRPRPRRRCSTAR
jgi:hypothetical protein